MRSFRSRMDDSTFELNLAPMLDIIVSIVPMLLLSIVFVRITVIETPVPQAVQKAIDLADENKDVQIVLAFSKQSGFKISVTDKGETQETNVAMKGADLDMEQLHKEMVTLKQRFPGIFRLELHPDESIELTDIVSVMDQVRMAGPTETKFQFSDKETGKPVETNLMFPDVVFGNVAGG